MPFVHECPGCSKKRKVKDELRGRKVKCPDCGTPNVLGGGGGKPKRSAAAAPPPAMAALPPVVNQRRTRERAAARAKAEETEKAATVSDDALYGRAEALGTVDEAEYAKQQRQTQIIVACFMLGLAGLVGGYLYTSGAFAGPEAYMPTKFVEAEGPDEKYLIQVPEGWTVEQQRGGGNKSEYFRVKNDKISINIKPNLMATLTGDIVGSTQDLMAMNAPGGEIPDNMKEVHLVHQKIKDSYANSYNDYQEDPIKVLKGKAGDLRYSRYNGRTPAFLRDYGFRGTVKIGAMHYIVDATMPESYLDEFEKHYRKIFESIEPQFKLDL